MAHLELSTQDTIELLTLLNASLAVLNTEIGRLAGTLDEQSLAALAALDAHREVIRKWIHRLSPLVSEQ